MWSLVPADAVPLGLGCSHLGSVGGVSRDEARALLHKALEEGVRFFDTSNIYGQGDSERFLAEALAGRDDCVISSKAGKYVTWHRSALVPLKGLIRASIRRSSNAKRRVHTSRAKPMPTCWDAAFLTQSLDGTLRRLRRERIELFLLHSPPVGVIRAGDAVSALELARKAGKVDIVGVAVDDAETALACLTDDRIKVLQIPLRPGGSDYSEVLDMAAAVGVAIVAREILGGAAAIAGHSDPAGVARARIIEVAHDPRISLPLVGATRIETLTASIEAVRESVHPDPGSARLSPEEGH